MCIIIRKNAGKMLKFEVYDNCISEHEDGVGIAYVHDNKIVVKKGLWKLTELFDEIRDIEEEKDILFHFRTASPGMDISVDNCHPFLIESTINLLEDGTPRYQYAITHNGRLSWRSTKDKSDTRHIIEDAIQPHLDRDPYIFDFAYGMIMMNRLINHATSDNNKMAILALDRETKTHEIHIINEQAGNVDCDTWFSNTSWRWPKIMHNQHQFNHAMQNEMGYGYGEGYEGVHNYAKNRRNWNDGYVNQSERKKKDENVETLSSILAKRFPGFLEFDKSGWAWDFTTHDWHHQVSKAHVPNLSYRVPPYDPSTYRSIRNLRLKAKDPIPEVVVVPDRQDAEIVPMSGNPFTPIQNQVVPIQTKIITQTPIDVPRDIDKDKLDHLDKSGVSVLCHESKALLLHQGYSQTCIGKMRAGQKIEHLRDAMRYTFDACRDMDDVKLDECTISSIKSETLDRKALYDDALPPKRNIEQPTS